MKKMILLMLVLGLVFAAGIVSADNNKFINCLCWQLLPYPDTIKVCYDNTIGNNFFPAAVTGSWVIDVSGGVAPPHKRLITMHGSLQKDLTIANGGSGKLALELEGTARDLTFEGEETAYSFPCYIQAIFNSDWSSASFPFPPPNGPLKSSVSAWCDDLFADNPFVTPNSLKPINCYNPPILNPIGGGENTTPQ
jgi:hypothetical protein